MTSVLIVDDDPTQARALARAISRLCPDFTVLTADNGLEASLLMQQRSVDLVLTDLQMPEMDGFELVAWILSNAPDTSVFTMSAFGTPETAARLSSLGSMEYFTKPVDPKVAVARFNETLSQSIRGHVQNVSLASFLQLMEMERKTCDLAVACHDKTGILVVRKGQLVDARCGALRGEEAAIAIIAWPSPSITISRGSEAAQPTIEKSLGFIVMEAMRVQDENARNVAGPDAPASAFPPSRRTFRPSAFPREVNGHGAALNGHAQRELKLPSGARALAIVDSATGNVLRSAVKDGCPVEELARMAALVLEHETRTLGLCNAAEGVEELVLSTTQRCDVIRPLGERGEFALLVFAPEETNLVMARLELEQFIASDA